MTVLKGILITLASLALVAGVAIGGWNLNWWMANSSTNHIAHIYHNSYGAQSADEQQVQNLVTSIYGMDSQIASPATPASEVSALQAQRIATITQACGLAANINEPTPDIARFVSADCG